MNNPEQSNKSLHPWKELFYGWKMLVALCTIVFFCGGFGFFTYTVYIPRIEATLGWSRTIIGAGITVWAIMNGLAGPVVGVCMERYGARATITVGALLFALANVLLGVMQSQAVMFTAMVISGAGVAACTLVPSQTVITLWFERYRGRAMGLMMIGYGLGGMTLVPLANIFIESLGWRQSFGIPAACMVLIVVPLVLLFVRTRPSDLGLLPDGLASEETDPGAKRSVLTGVSVRRALTSMAFALLATIIMLHIYGQSVLNVHFFPFVSGSGFADQLTANFWSLTIGFSIAGNLLFGWAADRWHPKPLMVSISLLFAVAVGVLNLCIVRLSLTSIGPLFVFAMCHGLALGGAGTVTPVFIGWCFGARHFSKIIGLTAPVANVGTALGPFSAALIFDLTGSYGMALIVCLVGYVVSAVLALLVNRKRLEPYFETSD